MAERDRLMGESSVAEPIGDAAAEDSPTAADCEQFLQTRVCDAGFPVDAEAAAEWPAVLAACESVNSLSKPARKAAARLLRREASRLTATEADASRAGDLDRIAKRLGIAKDDPLRIVLREHCGKKCDPLPTSWSRPDGKRPGRQSDEAAQTILRTGWNRGATLAEVSHRPVELSPNLLLAPHGRPLLNGEWPSRLTLGRNETAGEHWECVCWHSDEDGDYLELSRQGLPDGVRHERQVYLARLERFAVLVEKVATPRRATVSLQSRLPLAGGVMVARDPLTRVVRCAAGGGEPFAAIAPLWLPYPVAQAEPAKNSLAVESGELVVTGSAPGGLYLPLVVDWSENGANLADWRRLTVSCEGMAVGRDQAAAYRWRRGSEGWLLMHHLHPPKLPHAAIGLHTDDETTLARVADGQPDSMLIVE